MLFRTSALLLALVSGLSATTLVAVWTPERLIVAADSLMITGLGASSACKISHSGSTWFALSGLVEDQAAGYKLAELAAAALGGSEPLPARLEKFVSLARAPLQRAVEEVRREAPADYSFLASGHPVVQAIFAEAGAGAPLLGVASFQLDASGTLRERADVVANGDDGRGPRILYAGQQSQIREYLKAHPDWYRGDVVNLSRKLVQLEEERGSGLVGGPVDILSLGPGRADWVQKKPECGD